MDAPVVEKPVPLALLLADQVYRDQATGKWIVAGVFNAIACTALPAVRETICIFFQITNFFRAVDLRLRIEHAEQGDVLLDMGGPIQASSPLQVVAKHVTLRQFPIPKDGKYWIMLKSGEEILVQVPLYVRMIQLQKESGHGHGTT